MGLTRSSYAPNSATRQKEDCSAADLHGQAEQTRLTVQLTETFPYMIDLNPFIYTQLLQRHRNFLPLKRP